MRRPLKKLSLFPWKIHEGLGFTLIEVIMVLVLASILGVFTFQYLTSSVLAFRTHSVRKEKSDDAVLALDRMSREIRDAKLSTVVITSPGTSPSTITFTRKNTTNMQDASTAVTFTLDTASKELRRQSAAGTSILAKNVQGFTASKDVTTGIITLAVKFLPASRTIDWQTTVYPRNS